MQQTEPAGLSPSSLNFLQDPSITSTYDPHHSLHSSFLSEETTSEINTNVPTQTSPRPIASSTPAGPSRKQNVACDACRAKKIRCKRTTIAEICEQCATKSGDCTSNYIEQLQAKAKNAKASRGTNGDTRPSVVKRKRSKPNEEEEEGGRSQSMASAGIVLSPFATLQSSNRSTLNHAESSTTPQGSFSASARPPSERRPSERQANLIRYLLSPTPVMHHDFGYGDISSIEQCQAGSSDLWEEQGGDVWNQEPTEVHAGLTDVGMKQLSEDLVESFFSLSHPRHAILDPSSLRARLASPDTHPDGPIPHNLLAVLIAFGSRFSDHPVINADREECMGRDEMMHGPGQRPPRSRLVQLLVVRAREVEEVQKTFRIGGLLNIQVLILMETLLAQMPFSGERYQPYHLSAAVKHACVLGYNSTSTLTGIADAKQRRAASDAWWWIYTMDGYRSVFHRLKPLLPDSAYVCEPPTDPTGPLLAASVGADICRRICQTLWHPQAAQDGIALPSLESLITTLAAHMDEHIVPVRSKQFQMARSSAISAVITDAWYQTLWLVIDRAIRDFGVADSSEGMAVDENLAGRVQSAKKRSREEAERSAIRIAGLTSLLALNHYLRNDPLMLYHPIYEAGLYLAEQGREECMISVVGLRQYCIPYPQFWTQAEEIERLYNARLITGPSDTGMHNTNVSTTHPASVDLTPEGTALPERNNGLTAPPMPPKNLASSDGVPADLALNIEMANGTSTDVNETESEADKYLSSVLVEWLRQP